MYQGHELHLHMGLYKVVNMVTNVHSIVVC